jgi:hypothetical protein
VLGVAVLALIATGCDAHGNQAVAPATPTVTLSNSATAAASGTTLWRADSFPVALPNRWVMLDGTVGVTVSECFTIGDAVFLSCGCPVGRTGDVGGTVTVRQPRGPVWRR